MTTRSFNSIAGFSVGDPRTEIILANGDIQTTNLTANGAVNFTSSANVSLGSISNVHISGGNDGYFLATDGSGNLSWTYANVQIGGAYVFTKT